MKKTNIFLGLGIILQLASYGLPFLERSPGYLFFGSGMDAFFDSGVRADNWFLFVAFFFPILFLPLLLFAYWRGGIFKEKKIDYALFFILIIAPVLGAVGLVVERDSFSLGRLWGFITWVLSFGIFYGVFIFKRISRQEEEGDLVKHLIDNEN